MVTNPVVIIDLSDSFTRVHHPPFMSNDCIVIDSDDSLLIEDQDSCVSHLDSDFLKPINAAKETSVSISRNQTEDNIRLKQQNVVKEKKNNLKQHNVNRVRMFGDCPICFDPLGQNRLASTKCGHVYCMKCIEQYLSVDNRCPTCRQKLKGKFSYHPLYIGK